MQKRLRRLPSLLLAWSMLFCCLRCATNPNLTETPAHTYRGIYTTDASEFVECNQQTLMFLSDSTQQVLNEAKKINAAATNGVYIEVSGMAFSSDSVNIGTTYDSVLVIYKVLSIKPLTSNNSCALPSDMATLTLKEYGTNTLQFAQSRAFALPEAELNKKFPSFAMSQSGLGNDELNYEFRRGFGTITFNLDSTQTIQTATYAHPNSTDQYKATIGMTYEELKALRPTLKPFRLDDGETLLACSGSHIFYMPETNKNSDNSAPIDVTKCRIAAILWRKIVCP